MSNSNEKVTKRAYRAPQVTKVILRREQAILSVCRSGVSNVSAMNTASCAASCKRAASGGNNAGAAS